MDLHDVDADTERHPSEPVTAAREAAFFDLDKTIIAKSSVIAFGGSFYREGLISKRTIARGMYAQLVYLLVGADEAKMERMREAMLTLTAGWEQARIRQVVRETLDEVLSPIIYAEALDLIEEHRADGRLTVIISSSPAEVVEPLADYLGVDRSIATRAEVDADGRYTGALEFYAYGAHKADAIRELAAREDIDLDASYAYSDSITDLPMLEVVGHPVAVNADKELARAALERGWELRDFRHPVRLRDRMPVPNRPTVAAGTVFAAVGTGAALYLWLRRRASGPTTPARSGPGVVRRTTATVEAGGEAARHAWRAGVAAQRAVRAAVGSHGAS